MLNELCQVGSFREDFRYSNWTYSCVPDIIWHIAGSSLEVLIEQRMTRPLNIHTTTSMSKPLTKNNTRAYQVQAAGNPVRISRPTLSQETVCGAGGGIKSSVNDLLKLYDTFLQDYQEECGGIDSSGSSEKIFVQTKEMMHAHMRDRENPTVRYGLGLSLASLPCSLGLVSPNRWILPEMPLIGKDLPRTEIAYHNGSLPGSLTLVHMILENGITIVGPIRLDRVISPTLSEGFV